MVFWTTYPLLNLFKIIFNRDKFKCLKFKKKNVLLHPDLNFEIMTQENKIQINLEKIQMFLKKYFGDPPHTPILNIPIEKLLEENDTIIYIYNTNKEIIGCIRYHYIGKFITNNFENIYCVDCFCIHPLWRNKGIGDFLLTTLHNYAEIKNTSYAIFLKEGKPLNIFSRPLYTGRYMFRKLNNYKLNKIQDITLVKSIISEKAYYIMNYFLKFNNYFIVRNWRGNNQYWKLYKNDLHKILACFQDTYQEIHTEESKSPLKIAWCTAWFETPDFPDKLRESAAIALTDSIYPSFDYVWMNSEWIGNNKNGIWNFDGYFHWYTYQWTTSIKPSKSYCLTI